MAPKKNNSKKNNTNKNEKVVDTTTTSKEVVAPVAEPVVIESVKKSEPATAPVESITQQVEPEVVKVSDASAIPPTTPAPKHHYATLYVEHDTTPAPVSKLPMQTPATGNVSYNDVYTHVGDSIESHYMSRSVTHVDVQSAEKSFTLDNVYAADVSPLRNAPEDERSNPTFNPKTPYAQSKGPIQVTPEVSSVNAKPSSRETSPVDKIPVAFASTSNNRTIPIYIKEDAVLKIGSTKSVTSTVSTTSTSSVYQSKHIAAYHQRLQASESEFNDRRISSSNSGVVTSFESAAVVFDDIASEITDNSTNIIEPEPIAAINNNNNHNNNVTEPYTGPKPAYREQLLPATEPEPYTLVDQFKDTILSLLGFKTNCEPADMTLTHKVTSWLLDALLFFPLMWLSFYVWLFQQLFYIATLVFTFSWNLTQRVVSAPLAILCSALLVILKYIPGGSKLALRLNSHTLKG